MSSVSLTRLLPPGDTGISSNTNNWCKISKIIGLTASESAGILLHCKHVTVTSAWDTLLGEEKNVQHTLQKSTEGTAQEREASVDKSESPHFHNKLQQERLYICNDRNLAAASSHMKQHRNNAEERKGKARTNEVGCCNGRANKDTPIVQQEAVTPPHEYYTSRFAQQHQ